jgi:hypothetical protein
MNMRMVHVAVSLAVLALVSSDAQTRIAQSAVEVVTANASTGDGGQAWGGHQTRIVRTAAGVFTAYTVAGDGPLARYWYLVQRQPDGTWAVIASGGSGKDPVNLLASPSGTVYVIAWPDGVGTIWAGRPTGGPGQVAMTREVIPQVVRDHWPYASAGIDADGNHCVLSSQGGQTPGGRFDYACYLPARGRWITHRAELDFKYAYTYVFPDPGGQLSLVATRDVRWSALGYQQPAGSFDYVFNAYRYWRTRELVSRPIEPFTFVEEPPTRDYPDPYLNAQMDAYIDTQDRMHILYWRRGATTAGDTQRRHRIVLPSGVVTFDGEMPSSGGWYYRIFQDSQERFYLLGSAGLLYPLGDDGMTVGEPVSLDLGGYTVEYSGFGVSVPRTGTPRSDVMDVVFPSGNGTQWLYFRLDLSGRVE